MHRTVCLFLALLCAVESAAAETAVGSLPASSYSLQSAPLAIASPASTATPAPPMLQTPPNGEATSILSTTDEMTLPNCPALSVPATNSGEAPTLLEDIFFVNARVAASFTTCDPASKFVQLEAQDKCFMTGGHFRPNGGTTCYCGPNPANAMNPAGPPAYDPNTSGCSNNAIVGEPERAGVIQAQYTNLSNAALSDGSALDRLTRVVWRVCKPSYCVKSYCCQHLAQDLCTFYTGRVKGTVGCQGYNFACGGFGHRISMVKLREDPPEQTAEREQDRTCIYSFVEPTDGTVLVQVKLSCKYSDAEKTFSDNFRTWLNSNPRDATSPFQVFLTWYPALTCGNLSVGLDSTIAPRCCRCRERDTLNGGIITFYPNPDYQKGESDGSAALCQNRCSALGKSYVDMVACPDATTPTYSDYLMQ